MRRRPKRITGQGIVEYAFALVLVVIAMVILFHYV